jgi:hypothetical protein
MDARAAVEEVYRLERARQEPERRLLERRFCGLRGL